MPSLTILVTGPRLAHEAVGYLQKHGYQLVYMPPYATPDALFDTIVQTKPIAILSRMGRIDARSITAATGQLRVIAKHGVGVDNIDVDTATAHAIPVVIAYGANAQSVAEHTLALLLAVVKQLLPLDSRLRKGHWDKPDFLGREISGGCLALIGLGVIALRTAALAKPYGLHIVAYDPYASDTLFADAGVQRASSLKDALSQADFVSLHCPLTAATHHLINAETLAAMKPGAYLVNTARGQLIDEAALLDALHSSRLAGAGLDTFEQEPPTKDHPFWSESRLVLSPHIGGVTEQASARVSLEAARNIVAVLSNTPIETRRVVNAAALRKAGTNLPMI